MASSKFDNSLKRNGQMVCQQLHCAETLYDHGVLACHHKFCMKCIDEIITRNKSVEKVCPVCNASFDVPAKVYYSLPKTMLVDRMLQICEAVMNAKNKTCDMCACLKQGDKSASMYCVDCEEYICEQCWRNHTVMTTNKHHTVSALGIYPEVESVFKPHLNTNGEQLDRIGHLRSNTRVSPYMTCLYQRNKSQNLGETGKKVSKELKNEIKPYMTCLYQRNKSHNFGETGKKVSKELKNEIIPYMDKIDEIVLKIRTRLNEFDDHKEALDENVSQTESQIRERGEEVKQLLDGQIESTIEQLHLKKQKRLEEIENAKTLMLWEEAVLENAKNYAKKFSTVSPLTKTAFVQNLNKTHEQHYFELDSRNCKQVEISLKSTSLGKFKAEKSTNLIGRITDFHTLPSILNHGNPPVFLRSRDSRRTIGKYVVGIAIITDKLFLLNQKSRDIDIFDCCSFEYRSSITVPGLNRPRDMAACIRYNIIFISDPKIGRIHRIKVPQKLLQQNERIIMGKIKNPISSWHTGKGSAPWSLSISMQNNLLAVCGKNAIIEYNTNGRLIRKISLQNTISNVQHAVQLDIDRFLVCHHGFLHRVCLVDGDGHIIKSYGKRSGSKLGQLNYPCHMMADKDGSVLVVDRHNNRVVLLNSNLEYVSDYIPSSTSQDFRLPLKICLDDRQQKLYVGNVAGQIHKFDCSFI